jgi:hypothetical protein
MVPVFSEFTQQPEMRATRCKCERATIEEVLTLEDGSEFDEQLRRAAGLEPAASGQSELTFPDQKKNAGRGDTRDQSDEVLGRPA